MKRQLKITDFLHVKSEVWEHEEKIVHISDNVKYRIAWWFIRNSKNGYKSSEITIDTYVKDRTGERLYESILWIRRSNGKYEVFKGLSE